MSSRRLIAILLASCTILLAIFILTDALPNLRGPAPGTTEWYWPYSLRPIGRWWAPLSAAAVMLVVAAWWLGLPKERPRATYFGLVALVLCCVLLQLGLIYADRPEVGAEIINRTLSNPAGGFFQPAGEITDLAATLRNYPGEMPKFSSDHARTHPPGLVSANWMTIQLFKAAPALALTLARPVWHARCTDLWLLERPPGAAAALGTWAVLPLIAAGLTILPAYYLALRLLPRAAARLAAVMSVTIPALLLFAPKSVQLFAPLSLTAFFALDLGLERRSSLWFFLSGLLLSVSTFLSLGNASLLLAMVIYAWLRLSQPGTTSAAKSGRWWLGRRGSLPKGLSAIHVLSFGLGAASLWLLFWLGWKTTPWSIVETGLQQHYLLVTSQRRFDWWVSFNLVDLLLYSGLPLAIGFLLALWAAIRGLISHNLERVGMLAISLAILILLLDVSGTTRGEVGRLWLFFMPLMALASASFLAQVLPGRKNAILIIGLQLAITVSLAIAWKPVRAVIVIAERPETPKHEEPARPVTKTFNEASGRPAGFELVGYDLPSTRISPDSPIELKLYWLSTRLASRPYTVFTHLVDASGTLWAQQDNWPVNGRWPPTCWSPGDMIVDTYRIELPSNIAPGTYTLLVGLYDATTGLRLQATDGGDAITLSDVTVSGPK